MLLSRMHSLMTGVNMQEIGTLKAQLQDLKRHGESRMAKVRAELSAVRSEAAARMRDLEGQLAEARGSPPWRKAGAQAEAVGSDASRAAEAEISGLHAALQEAQQAMAGAMRQPERCPGAAGRSCQRQTCLRAGSCRPAAAL